MKNIYVIYHSADFDGIFSREIARHFITSDAEFIGWDYGDPLPTVPLDAELIMIDISVEGMMDHPKLTWIDHHKSAIAKYPATIGGYRIDGVSACRLAWQWFTQSLFVLPPKEDFINRTVIEPLAVRLAGEYDVFDHRDPSAALFQHGLKTCEPDFGILLGFGDVAETYVAHLLDAGRGLQYAQTKLNESIIKQAGFTVQFEGLCFLACNHARYNSFLFTAGLKPEHDALLGFAWAGDKWRVSLYGAPGKSDLDLSLIASKFGGGGHKQACGFECASLPFGLVASAEVRAKSSESDIAHAAVTELMDKVGPLRLPALVLVGLPTTQKFVSMVGGMRDRRTRHLFLKKAVKALESIAVNNGGVR